MATMTPTTMITPALAAANRFAPKTASAPNAVKEPDTNAAATNGPAGSAATNAPTNAAGATGAANAASTNAPRAANASDEAADRFLTLLVTQLRNQDPLNPLDNAQVTTQLAQLSTVSGINKLNEAVAALSASFAAGQYLEAVGLVGRDVVVAGDKLLLDEGKSQYGMALATNADAVAVTIKDAAGVVVRTIDLGAQKSGIRTFEWDGTSDAGATLPDGQYSMSVTATAKGEAVALDTLTIARVSGVAPTPQGTMLSLGTLGTIALGDILQIN